jgi:hypothetical protein
MKRLWSVVTLLVFCAGTVLGASAQEQNWKALGTLRNAQFVYVTSYDGSQSSRNLLSEDRAAISRVQDAVQSWGGYTIVYRPQQADMIIAVMSRGSEDVLAVYSRGFSHYLWRASQKRGFSAEGSLLAELRADLDRTKSRDKPE